MPRRQVTTALTPPQLQEVGFFRIVGDLDASESGFRGWQVEAISLVFLRSSPPTRVLWSYDYGHV